MTKKIQQNKSFTVFDWVKEVTYNKTPWEFFDEDQVSTLNIYVLNRVLSMNPYYLELVNYVQSIPYTSKENYYKIYSDLLPKKTIFNKYIKSTTSRPHNELIEYLKKYFELGSREIELYIQALEQDEIISILTQMGVDDKKIKELTNERSNNRTRKTRSTVKKSKRNT